MTAIQPGGEMKALIIEDSFEVAEAVSLCCQLRWPEISINIAADGSKGKEFLQGTTFDIVILDINLPDTDGFEILKWLRSFSNTPVIILTVRGSIEDQVKGLEMGADDYLVKPFKPRELVSRMYAVLRRANTADGTGEKLTLSRGKLTLNMATDEAQLREEKVKLTPIESKLLYILMKNTDQTLNAKDIQREVWGEDYTTTDLLRTYIRRLRAKLSDEPPQIILNQRGEGYSFVSPN